MSIHRACCCCPESILLTFTGSSTLSTACFAATGAVDTVGGLSGRYKIKSLDMSGDHVIPLDPNGAPCLYVGVIPDALVLEQYRQNGIGLCDTYVADCTFDVRVFVSVRKSDDGDRSITSVTIDYLIYSNEWCNFNEGTPGDSVSSTLFFAVLPTCVKAPMTCARYGDSIPDQNTATGETVDAFGGSVVISAV